MDAEVNWFFLYFHFKHFRSGNSTPTCEMTRAGNGLPDDNEGTNPVG